MDIADFINISMKVTKGYDEVLFCMGIVFNIKLLRDGRYILSNIIIICIYLDRIMNFKKGDDKFTAYEA